MNNTVEELKTKSKNEVLTFIRETLKFPSLYKQSIISENPPHLRFDMTGYSVGNNNAILGKFEFLGIYDGVDYLFIKFHKGTPEIYIGCNDENLLFDNWSGYTTSEIIYEIFKLTIFK